MSSIKQDRDALDMLVEDSCASQRTAGTMPTPEENARYMAGVLSHLQTTTVTPPNPEEERQRGIEEAAMRAGIDGDWTVTHRPAPQCTTPVRAVMDELQELLVARIRLIRSSPDWMAKAKTINPLAMAGALGPDKQAHALQLWQQIISDSNRVWGDWKKPKVKPIYIGAGGPS